MPAPNDTAFDPQIRQLGKLDQPAITDHFLRLDAKARRARFGNAVGRAFVERYAGRILQMDGAVFGVRIAGDVRALAELREALKEGRLCAEAAFSVEPDWQGRGLGTGLMARIVEEARRRGLTSLNMHCLRDNERMRRLASKHQGQMAFTSNEMVSLLDLT